MTSSLHPCLMFEGKAEEAMNFYVSVFPNSRIERVERYDAAGPGPAGTVKHASFSLDGQAMACMDSPVKHEFTFTPSISFFVDCKSEDEVKQRFTALGEGGKVYMPVDNYGFSRLFGWVGDRYGVTWQLNFR